MVLRPNEGGGVVVLRVDEGGSLTVGERLLYYDDACMHYKSVVVSSSTAIQVVSFFTLASFVRPFNPSRYSPSSLNDTGSCICQSVLTKPSSLFSIPSSSSSCSSKFDSGPISNLGLNFVFVQYDPRVDKKGSN